MLAICPVCGEEFNAERAKKYCKPECVKRARELRRIPNIRVCSGCGIKFKPTGQNQKYHSVKCRKDNTYEDHYKNSVMKLRDKNLFGGNRELALRRDGYGCTVCGGTQQLSVHHKDRSGQTDNPNHDLSNLVTLCNPCHCQEHRADKMGDRTAFETTCQECGEVFKTTPYRISIGAGSFCGAECRDRANITLTDEQQKELQHSLTKPNWIVVQCSNPACGKEFEVPPNRVKRSLDKHGKIVLYHHRSCRTITENHKRAKPKPKKPTKLTPREGFKFCTKCGDELPTTTDFFHKRVDNGTEKLKNTCKKCVSLKESSNYTANREAIRARQNKSHNENKDEINARSREKYQNGGKEKKSAYYEGNKEAINEKALHRREGNRENIRAIAREYSKRPEVKKRITEQRKANPEKFRKQYNLYYHGAGKERIIAIGKRREAKKKNAVATLTPEQWLDTLDSFDNCCVYCGEKLVNVQQDHVIPVSAGGGYTKLNMLPACKSCNSSKHNHLLEEWYPRQPYFLESRLVKIHAWIGFDTKSNTQQLALC